MAGSGIALIPTPDELFGYGEKYEQARARTEARGSEPCVSCGRPVKPGSGWLVEIVNGGHDIAHPGLGPDTTDAGYMGAFVMGSDCARRVPVEFRTRWQGWGA